MSVTVDLRLGDCLAMLGDLKADAVITDPPYGIDFGSNGQRFKASRPIANDVDDEAAVKVAEAFAGTPLAMFFSPYRPLPVKWRSVLVWNKGAHVGIGGDRATCWKRDFELIGVRDNRPLNGKRDSAMLHIPALLPPPSGHVAEKPVKLMAYLIRKLTQPGDTVLDPFAGSGSTAVACVETGRHFIGFESDPAWYDVAARRIEAARNATPLFA